LLLSSLFSPSIDYLETKIPREAIALPIHGENSTNQKEASQLEKIAFAVTVKVIAEDRGGSGVLIHKQGRTYTVITNNHVVSQTKSIRIQTADGHFHQTARVKGINYRQKDLILLQFTSSNNYTIAESESLVSLTPKIAIFAGGYPFSSDLSNRQGFVLTQGQLQLITQKPLQTGYQIGYTNDIQKGMSGGPILTQTGKLIGINGIHAELLWGNPYIYEDGSQPSQLERDLMSRFSWGIPIQTLAQIAPQYLSGLQSKQPQPSTETIPLVVDAIEKIARAITVQIKDADNSNCSGSGAIISKQGNSYMVLTAEHVIRETENCRRNKLLVVAPDGKEYSLTRDEGKNEKIITLDLAIVNFNSAENYQVAAIANNKLERDGGLVFVAGYPQKTSTLDLLFTAGTLSSQKIKDLFVKDSFSFSYGYGLIYSNITAPGVSGGPILDIRGNLVGIHGRIEGDILVEQSGDKQIIQLGSALGVPISSFLALLPKINLKEELLKIYSQELPPLSKDEEKAIKASIFKAEKPNDNANAIAWLSYGDKLLRGQKYQEAKDAFDRALKIDPTLYQAWYEKGLAFFYENNSSNLKERYTQALAAFDRSLEISQHKFSLAWRMKTSVLISLKKYDEALIASERAIELEPKEFIHYLFHSVILINLNRYREALVDLERAWQLKPHPIINSNRSVIYYHLGDYQQGVKFVELAIKIQPDLEYAYNNRGMFYVMSGEYQKALQDFNRALEIDPNLAQAYINKGVAYQLTEVKDRAIADYNKAIELEPDLAEAYSNRGFVYVELGEPEKGFIDLNKAIEIEPNNSKLYWNRAVAYQKIGNKQKASSDFDRAIKINRQDFTAYILAGNFYLENKDKDKAFIYFNKAVALAPNNPFVYNQRGLAYQNLLQDYQKAVLDFTKTIELKSDSIIGYNNRGYAYVDLEKYQDALTDFERVIELNSKIPEAYHGKGLALYYLEDYQKALENYNRAIELKVNYVKAYKNRASAYEKLKNYDKAIADYTKVIELNPQDASAYNIRGVGYQDLLQDYLKAILDYNKAISLKPDLVVAYENRASAYKKLKNYDKVIADYTKVIELNPQDASAYNIRGVAYQDLLEDYQKAILDYNKAISLQPDFLLAYRNRGWAYYYLQDYVKALADFNQAIEIKSDDANSYDGRGTIYHKQRNYSQALAEYKHTLTLDEKFWPTLGKIGLIAYESGDIKTALEYWQQALQINSEALHPKLAIATVNYLRGNKQEALNLAKQVLKSEPDFASIDYVKKQTLWGAKLLENYQKFLEEIKKDF
jgi:tetratricopeptide (TPR) repeat protein